MAISNSTTLNDLIGQIVSADAQSAAYANRVMRPLVRGYSVPAGAGSIVVPRFQSVAVASLTEGVAPASTTMNSDGVTLTPVERGTYVQISKRTLHADPFQDLAPYGDQLGRALAQDEDSLILDAMDFTTHINDTSDAMDDSDFRAAIATLEAANAPGPYFAVFHPNSWAKLRAVFDDAATYATVGRQTVEGFGQGFSNAAGYVGSPYGIPCFISTQVNDDGAATPSRRYNALFSRESLGAAWIKDIGVDVDDNVVARAIDLMAWYSFNTDKLVDSYGVIIEDNLG
jgi:N4-gp56 family major capsid protein